MISQAQLRAAQATSPGPPGRQEVVGRLSGDDVSVTGAISFENENGRTNALLASGSDLTLRSSQAKIDLPEGGDIILCGPAYLSFLKSGPAITNCTRLWPNTFTIWRWGTVVRSEGRTLRHGAFRRNAHRGAIHGRELDRSARREYRDGWRRTPCAAQRFTKVLL